MSNPAATFPGPELRSAGASTWQRSRHERRPSASPLVRLRTLPDLRRPIPARLAVARAEHRGRVAWEISAGERKRAVTAMKAVLSGTQQAGRVQELARAHVIENHVRDAFFWRPWGKPTVDRESRAHLQAALASGRGVLLSRCHLGAFFLGAGALGELEAAPYTTIGPWLFEPLATGPWARRVDRWRRGVEGMGEQLLNTKGSYELLAALLERRELVQIYFDMPGGKRTSFLGKPVMLAGGSARLAEQTDALILPMHLYRSAHRISARIRPALDPREHPSHEELQDALAQVHERAILLAPATLEDPARSGAWEDGAGALEWAKPSSLSNPARTAHWTPGAA
jgi:lauroyl/myristoyl acyltransferase